MGYLLPTRGLLFEHKDLFIDYAFNSFPPFFYCVLAPFALLPNAIASLLWSLAQLACFLVAVSLFAHLTKRLWGLPAPRVVAPVLMAAPLVF